MASNVDVIEALNIVEAVMKADRTAVSEDKMTREDFIGKWSAQVVEARPRIAEAKAARADAGLKRAVVLPLLSQLFQVFGVKWAKTANDLLTVYVDGELEMGDAALAKLDETVALMEEVVAIVGEEQEAAAAAECAEDEDARRRELLEELEAEKVEAEKRQQWLAQLVDEELEQKREELEQKREELEQKREVLQQNREEEQLQQKEEEEKLQREEERLEEEVQQLEEEQQRREELEKLQEEEEELHAFVEELEKDLVNLEEEEASLDDDLEMERKEAEGHEKVAAKEENQAKLAEALMGVLEKLIQAAAAKLATAQSAQPVSSAMVSALKAVLGSLRSKLQQATQKRSSHQNEAKKEKAAANTNWNKVKEIQGNLTGVRSLIAAKQCQVQGANAQLLVAIKKQGNL
jgi:DNA repair exonuclease SbcCD ATPase subunit